MLSRSLLLAPLAVLASSLDAQTLTAGPFLQGQIAEIDLSGLPAGSLAVLLSSPLGAGSGPCLEPGPSACLGLANPILVLGSATATAGGDAAFAFALPPDIPLVTVAVQGLSVAPGAGGALDFEVTNVASQPIEPISALDDDFDGPGLDAAWQVLHPGEVALEVVGGALSLVPVDNSLWFNNSESALVYKEVTGDFEVTTSVEVFDPAEPASPPAPQYRLGGLLVRDPAGLPASPLNWVHLAAGAGELDTPLAVEHKRTVDSVSSFDLIGVSSLSLELRIVRIGSQFELSYREDAKGPWSLAQVYDHPTLPATVHVGLMCYSPNAPAGVAARFGGIAFAQP
ncbi:MAG: hypothetical protein AAF682_17215 [Planctomycetota bacterium]